MSSHNMHCGSIHGGRTKCQPDKMPTGRNANQRLAYCPDSLLWLAFCPSQFLVGILSPPSKHVGMVRTKCQPKFGTDKMPTTEKSPDKMPTFGWHFVRLAFCPTILQGGRTRLGIATSRRARPREPDSFSWAAFPLRGLLR